VKRVSAFLIKTNGIPENRKRVQKTRSIVIVQRGEEREKCLGV
jgi:hypothetical protein